MASLAEVVPDGDLHYRFIWNTDVLSEQARDWIAPLVDTGCAALKNNLETGKA